MPMGVPVPQVGHCRAPGWSVSPQVEQRMRESGACGSGGRDTPPYEVPRDKIQGLDVRRSLVERNDPKSKSSIRRCTTTPFPTEAQRHEPGSRRYHNVVPRG